MIAKREKALAARGQRKCSPVELREEPVDPDNANAALLVFGIACRDPRWADRDPERDRLLLEPWAVQTALSRRRGGSRLTGKEVAEVRAFQRAPGGAPASAPCAAV